MADADNRDIPVIVEAKNAPDIALEFIDIIANALLAKLSERREVLADLLRRDAETAAELIGRDDVAALILQQTQRAEVQRQTVNRRL